MFHRWEESCLWARSVLIFADEDLIVTAQNDTAWPCIGWRSSGQLPLLCSVKTPFYLSLANQQLPFSSAFWHVFIYSVIAFNIAQRKCPINDCFCNCKTQILLSPPSENQGRSLSHSSYSINAWINYISLLEPTLFGERKNHLNSIS